MVLSTISTSPAEVPKVTREGESALYLRFGEVPPTGCSADWRKGKGRFLAGVSCFKARRSAEGGVEVDVSSDIRLPVVFDEFSKKPLDAFLIEGREVGAGNCGEPLLSDVKVIEKLSPRPRITPSGPAPQPLRAFIRWLSGP